MSKKKLFLSYILFHLNGMFIYAEPKYPVDVSYLVSDFKYSQEHGLKICEVQHGALSAITGDLYISGEDGSISPMIADFFALFPIKKWAVGLIYPPLKRSLAAKGWDVGQSIKTLLKDPTFLECATLPPIDPFSIISYAGIVFADFDVARNFNSYCKAYPGILFINAVTFPYWRDKYKMNMLFDLNDELKQYKADWRLYPKKYDFLLSERIQEEMPSEFYVIKPRREVLANGVIVLANRDLDNVLEMILNPLANLEKHPDKKYSYWWKNKDDTFLIEKYYKSDSLYFSIPLSEKISCYDATMRLAFILQYDRGKMTYHCLGGFWKLPSKALEEGTLNETRISCCRPPFYKAVDPELLKEVNTQMQRAMLLLYEVMLNEHSH
ncbi:MAG: hypothetical protein ACRDAI_07830 [Candidatus Rhabdochlamydia sp.]